jgi:SAM-dependent methyltransferase
LSSTNIKPEFDQLADDYEKLLGQAVHLSGEAPDFFAEYKIADLHQLLDSKSYCAKSILDFGSGTGNSIPFFRKYFSGAQLHNADVSPQSNAVAKKRFPGDEEFCEIKDKIPLFSDSQDLVFSSCVFHHIPPAEHAFWFQEILRVLKPGGYLAIYEHNPFNPLTQWVVRHSPLDVNAILVSPKKMMQLSHSNAFVDSQIAFKLFFPKSLSFLRPYEHLLERVPLGAQYRYVAQKPIN